MRNKLLWFVVMVAGLQVAGGRLQAHHAFAAEFDAEKKVTMDGTVAEMHWINPHAWLYVDVPGPDGTVDRWGFEFGAPNALIRRGWTKSTVPLGLELTIVGYLAKDGRKLAYAETVLLPDGRKLFAGSSGAGAPQVPK